MSDTRDDVLRDRAEPVHSSAYCVEITNGPTDIHCGNCEAAMDEQEDEADDDADAD